MNHTGLAEGLKGRALDRVSRSQRRSLRVRSTRSCQAHEQKTTDGLEQDDRAAILDVRTAVLNETLEDAFRHRYFGPPTMIKLYHRPRDIPRFCMLSLSIRSHL